VKEGSKQAVKWTERVINGIVEDEEQWDSMQMPPFSHITLHTHHCPCVKDEYQRFITPKKSDVKSA